jgi:hypothetical protein
MTDEEIDEVDRQVTILMHALIGTFPRPVDFAHALSASIATAVYVAKRTNLQMRGAAALAPDDLRQLVEHYWDRIECVAVPISKQGLS